MQTNQIFVSFLTSLSGFLKLSDNSVLHLPGNQIITAHTEPEWLKVEFPLNEMLIIEIGREKFNLNYKLVVDTCIASHCQTVAITTGASPRDEFLSCKAALQSRLDSNNFLKGIPD